MKRILLVDDENSVHYAFKRILGNTYELISALTASQAREKFLNEDPDLVLLDLKLPDGNGLDLLREFKALKPEIPIIIITAFADSESAIFAMKEGAYDYLSKPFDFIHLMDLLKKALKDIEKEGTKDIQVEENCPVRIIGKSKAILEVSKLIGQIANSNVPVLIVGESGVGKELVARAIHCFSNRRNKPFVAINCASLPDTLIESELFGYEPGAFTSAEKRKLGKIEVAKDGTLFLDEIGDMSLTAQAKLLRFLQEKTFERLGGNKSIKVDVRIIAATNKNLQELIKKGGFREDLYHRLNVVTIEIPPLRERKEDISLLVEYFIHKTNQEVGTNVKGITKEALSLLENYSFPGNVRELENIIKRAVILSKGPYITPEEIKFQTHENLNDINSLIKILIEKSFNVYSVNIYHQVIREIEKALIQKALEITGGNQVKASSLLGINRLTLRKKLEELPLSLFRK